MRDSPIRVFYFVFKSSSKLYKFSLDFGRSNINLTSLDASYSSVRSIMRKGLALLAVGF